MTSEEQENPKEIEGFHSLLEGLPAFLRKRWWAVVCLSVALLTPCFWQRHIEAGDLGSHVYNAWLVTLVEKGQTPGVYVVSQWHNVLFDKMLSLVAEQFGFWWAEKIVVSVCVLIFFWGVFALVGVVARCVPWWLTPCMAMLSYGYVFNMGFFNYYLSVGLACWGLALIWRGGWLEYLLAAGIALLVMLAHPLGLLFLLGVGAFVKLWQLLGGWWRLPLPLLVIAGGAAIHWRLAHHLEYQADWLPDPFYLSNGADQLVLYGQRYAFVAYAAFLVGVLWVIVDRVWQWRGWSVRKDCVLALVLYGLAVTVTALVPENLRPAPDAAWIGLLVSRLTLITGVFGLSVLGFAKPRFLPKLGFAACAAVFFVFLWQDGAYLNRLEANVNVLVRDLPGGTKVLGTLGVAPESRVPFVGHIVDRACIGHCFSYGNYEASSKQFRVRVQEGSPVVTSYADDTEDMGSGNYEVQEEDMPLKQIYQCDLEDLTKVCIRDLVIGEKNGRLGYKPEVR